MVPQIKVKTDEHFKRNLSTATENVNRSLKEKKQKLQDGVNSKNLSVFDTLAFGKHIDALNATLDFYEDLRYLVGMNEEGYIYVSAQDLRRLYSYV